MFLMPYPFSQYDSETRVSTDGIVPLAGNVTAIDFTGIYPSLRPRHITTKYL